MCVASANFPSHDGDDVRDTSEVQVPLAGLVKVHGAGLWGAQQVEAAQSVAGQRQGALHTAAGPLMQEASTSGKRRGVAGRVQGGAALDDGCVWPAGGDSSYQTFDHNSRERDC